MHNGLIGLILEIAVPTTPEMWGRPGIHLSEFLLSWTNFHTCVDAIGSQRTCALNIPLIKNFLLHFRYATNKVIETLSPCGEKGLARDPPPCGVKG
jgi:hypothetical protein